MRNIITIMIAMFVIGCSEAEANNEISSIITEPKEIVEIDIDDMEFKDAFAIQHRAKGSNRSFWWRGNLYTTNLSETIDEFVLEHIKSGEDNMKWVLNNDDPDDDCYYNKRDECGVCNGTGKITWWMDSDGDGLGDHKEWIKSCVNPNQ